MASTSLLPHVGAGQAPITPQMGGGGNVSLLPEVPARIDAQLGGKPVKMKKIRKSKSVKVQRGGYKFIGNEEKFYELIRKMSLPIKKEDKITDNNLKIGEYYFFIKFIKSGFSDFIEKLSKSINESKVDNIIKIRAILFKILTTFENFMEEFSHYNKLDDNFKTFKAIFFKPTNQKLIKNGVRILTLINYIDGTNKMTKSYGNHLIKITEEYENYVPNEEDEDKNTGKYKDYRNIIREELKKIIPPPAPPPSNGSGTTGTTGKATTTPPAATTTSSTATTTSAAATTTSPAATPSVTTPPATIATPETEEDKNKVCYEELKKKLNMDSPNFENTIKEIMKSIPVDQMSAIIRDPRYKDVRSLISQMITMKIDQFKTDLMAARGISGETVAIGPSGETVAIGPSGETVATPGTTPETTPGTTPETTPGTTPETTPGTTPETIPETTSGTTSGTTPETTPVTTSGTPGTTPESIDNLFKTYFETNKNYNGAKADDISNENIQKLIGGSDKDFKNDYYKDYDFQREALCGLHAINNLFIEERRANSDLKKFEREIFDELCKIMIEEGCPISGFYHKDVMTKFLEKQGYNVKETTSQDDLINDIEEIIKGIRNDPKTKDNVLNLIIDKGNKLKITYNENKIQYNNASFDFDEVYKIALSGNNPNNIDKELIKEISNLIDISVKNEKDTIENLKQRPEFKVLLEENIANNDNNLGLIMGSGSHWTTLRRLNKDYLEFRNSSRIPKSVINPSNSTQKDALSDDDFEKLLKQLEDLEKEKEGKPIEISHNIDDYIPDIYNINTDYDKIIKLFRDNNMQTYILVNKPENSKSNSSNPKTVQNDAQTQSPASQSADSESAAKRKVNKLYGPNFQGGGVKTRSKRRGIRVKKTKRRSKK